MISAVTSRNAAVFAAAVFCATTWPLAVPAQSLAAPFNTAPSARKSPDTLIPPLPGSWDVRAVTSNAIELFACTTAAPGGFPAALDFRSESDVPSPEAFELKVGGHPVRITRIGYKRRPVFAPRGKPDVRIGNWLYFITETPLRAVPGVSLKDLTGRYLSESVEVEIPEDRRRRSTAIHVSQAGCVAGPPCPVIVEKYAGTAGELRLDGIGTFELVDERTGTTVHSGLLEPVRETGFTNQIPPYTIAMKAVFPTTVRPGRYHVFVPGIGKSATFRIGPETGNTFARTFAIGMYHQRCGSPVELPWSRFTHAACHTAKALIPDRDSLSATRASKQLSMVAERARNSHFPFVSKGLVDVSGGYHDAGDYSKYLINSAAIVHTLVYAADRFDGVADIDNLGMPESGDGVPDVLQAAQREASFISKCQDADGGFYFLVYPKDRAYEDDVPPEKGDPQIVFPKNTAVTAAAGAALAQCARSPVFARHYPDEARRYLKQAVKAWEFLENARRKHGESAYEKITHYGDTFGDADETAWAAMELYLADGCTSCAEYLRRSFVPGTAKWGWLRMFEGYGNAVRSCTAACSPKPGAKVPSFLKETFCTRCTDAFQTRTADLLRWHGESAWGTSFPSESKRHRTAAWYFSSDNAFELVAAAQFDRDSGRSDARTMDAALDNLYFQAGRNPADISYVTGMGDRWPIQPVSQHALNDGRLLPPTGIIVGDAVAGCGWLGEYGRQLGSLTFPSDGDESDPYPLYDRYTDHWNVNAEMVTPVLARALAAATAISWRYRTTAAAAPVPRGGIEGNGPFRVRTEGRSIDDAKVIWETSAGNVFFGPDLSVGAAGLRWIELEAVWPDGVRLFDRRTFQ